MKRKLGVIGLLLAVVLTLALLPSMTLKAEAAAPSSIKVFGISLNSGSYMDTNRKVTTSKPSGGYLYYSNGVLTMSKFSGWDYAVRLIDSTGTLTINLVGDNTLINENYYGIYTTGRLTIKGTGSLTIDSTKAVGIWVENVLDIQAAVNVKATGAVAIYSKDNMSISANVTAGSDVYSPLNCNGSITVNSGNINVTAQGTDNVGIYAAGSMLVYGGNIKVESKVSGIRVGNYYDQYDGTVYVNSQTDNGMIVGARYTLHGGSATIYGRTYGIKANQFTATSGKLEVISYSTEATGYSAIKVKSNTKTDFNVPDYMVQRASTTTGQSGLKALELSGLSSYKRVELADMIQLRNITLVGGNYLGSKAEAPSATKPASGGYAYYKKGVLTLNDYQAKDARYTGVYAYAPLTVELQGSNKLETAQGNNQVVNYGIYAPKGLTLQGTGVMEVSGGSPSIYVAGTMDMKATAVTAFSDYVAGVEVKGQLNQISGTLGALGDGVPALKCQFANITGGELLAASGEIAVSSGIVANSGLKMTGGKLNIGVRGTGIVVAAGSVSMEGGEAKIISDGGNGITAGDMYVKSGMVYIESPAYGIQTNKLSVSGGMVQISCDNPLSETVAAVKLTNDITESTFSVSNALLTLGSTDPKTIGNDFVLSKLSTYRNLCIGDFVLMGGLPLTKGNYLAQGADKVTASKPSVGYAYYGGRTNGEGSLTLNNYQPTLNANVGIYYSGDLKISVTGNNLIQSSAKEGILVRGGLTLDGAGSLNVVSVGKGICAVGDLTVKANTVSNSSKSTALDCTGTLSIEQGTVTARANVMDGYGIRVTGNVHVSGGTVNVISKNIGIYVYNGNMAVSGGQLSVDSAESSGAYIIGKLTLAGGNVSSIGYYHGIRAEAVELKGGNLTAISENTENDEKNSAIWVDDPGKFVVSQEMSGTASVSSSANGVTTLNPAKCKEYDYIKVSGADVPLFAPIYVYQFDTNKESYIQNGQYLATGSITPVSTKPSGGYAYYKDNVLYLNNYVNKKAHFVFGGSDEFGLHLTGRSEIGAIGDNSYDLVPKLGTGCPGALVIDAEKDASLQVSGWALDAYASVYAERYVKVNSGDIVVNMGNNYGYSIYCEELILAQGVTAYASKSGTFADVAPWDSKTETHDYKGFIITDDDISMGATLVNQNGTLYYMVNGKIDDTFTGLFKYEGIWYFIKAGRVATEISQLVKYNNEWWYVVNGKVASDTTALIDLNGEDWYVVKGKIAGNTTGLVKIDGIWYYVVKGKVAGNTTTLVKFNGEWFYVVKGQVASTTTAMIEYNGEDWYIVRGKIAANTTGLVKYDGVWYYVVKGKLAGNTTTLVKYNGEWFYVIKGRVDSQTTGIVVYNGGWYYLVKGKIAAKTTTLVKYGNAWYYVKEGKVDFGYTGTFQFNGAWYNIKNGVKV